MSGNKALIQSLYAAFGRSDVAFILSQLAESVEWVSTCDAAVIPWGGSRRGHQGARSFFESLGGHLDFELFAPAEFAADGDLVFVRGRTVAKVKSSGRRFDSDWVHVFTVADGRVARFQEFYDTAAIVAALRGN